MNLISSMKTNCTGVKSRVRFPATVIAFKKQIKERKK